MSESLKNQAVIGAFVVGAVVLAVVSVVILGSGKLFQDTRRYVMFFEGSVKGLTIGAPVTFRGVKIGQVVDVTLRANPVNMEFRIPVVIEVDVGKIERTADVPYRHEQAFKELIDLGLRAKLDVQSLVTGQLLINLEMMPDEPLRLFGADHRYQEVPTVASDFERFAKKFDDLPVEEMIDKASSTLTALEAFLANPSLNESVNNINQAAANTVQITAKINDGVNHMADSIDRIADHADQLILNVNGQVQPLTRDTRRALQSAGDAAVRIGHAADAATELATGAQPTVDHAGQALANVADLTDPGSKERHEMRKMLNELSAAARSIRVWAAYLERHPEALIQGKGGTQRR